MHQHGAFTRLSQRLLQGNGVLQVLLTDLPGASAAGLLTQIGSLAYSITKAAAVSIGEWIAISHHHQGIRVSVLCPQAVATNIIANSPDNLERTQDGGVAGGDGVLTAEQTADECLAAIRDERFLVLPHPEVATYMERKATDRDRWLGGMRRFQRALYPDGPLPGDAIAPT